MSKSIENQSHPPFIACFAQCLIEQKIKVSGLKCSTAKGRTTVGHIYLVLKKTLSIIWRKTVDFYVGILPHMVLAKYLDHRTPSQSVFFKQTDNSYQYCVEVDIYDDGDDMLSRH